MRGRRADPLAGRPTSLADGGKTPYPGARLGCRPIVHPEFAMPKPHWRDFHQPRGITMNGSEFTTSLEHLRLEAERMKRRLEDFEVDALALQGSIFAAVARLIE